METFRYIYQDDEGTFHFGNYFTYLDTIRHHVSPALHAFFSDSKHYALHSDSTLHDSWFKTLCVHNTALSINGYAIHADVHLLLSSHTKEIALFYQGLKRLNCALQPEFWPDKPVDLLTHEFCITTDGAYRHFLLFDRGVWIELICNDIQFQITSGNSA